MPSPIQADLNQPNHSLRLGLTIATTILATLAFTVLSFFLGGFGSQEAKAGDEGGFSLPIIIHLATVVPALLLGPFILLRRKGDKTHRLLGRIWVVLMLITAIASAFIRSPGAGIAGTGFSFIHIFTIWTLVNAPLAVWMARKGNIDAHRAMMTGLYVGLLIAGATTFIPGRLLGNLVFGF